MIRAEQRRQRPRVAIARFNPSVCIIRFLVTDENAMVRGHIIWREGSEHTSTRSTVKEQQHQCSPLVPERVNENLEEAPNLAQDAVHVISQN